MTTLLLSRIRANLAAASSLLAEAYQLIDAEDDNAAHSCMVRDHSVAESIIAIVGQFYGFTRQEMMGRAKSAPIALATLVARYQIRKQTRMPLKTIGRLFSRDHHAIMYAIKAVSNRMDTDANFKADMARLEAQITKITNNENPTSNNPNTTATFETNG